MFDREAKGLKRPKSTYFGTRKAASLYAQSGGVTKIMSSSSTPSDRRASVTGHSSTLRSNNIQGVFEKIKESIQEYLNQKKTNTKYQKVESSLQVNRAKNQMQASRANLNS